MNRSADSHRNSDRPISALPPIPSAPCSPTSKALPPTTETGQRAIARPDGRRQYKSGIFLPASRTSGGQRQGFLAFCRQVRARLLDQRYVKDPVKPNLMTIGHQIAAIHRDKSGVMYFRNELMLRAGAVLPVYRTELADKCLCFQ